MAARCNECSDTGVIETGNNDLPCACSAGDMAIFNIAGEGQLSGAEIKRRDSLPQILTVHSDRTVYGRFYRWYEQLGLWHSTSGNAVMIVPPTTPFDSWFCIIPDFGQSNEIRGHDAEKRAFAIAKAYEGSP